MCIEHALTQEPLLEKAPSRDEAGTEHETAPERPEPLPEPDPCEPLSVTA